MHLWKAAARASPDRFRDGRLVLRPFSMACKRETAPPSFVFDRLGVFARELISLCSRPTVREKRRRLQRHHSHPEHGFVADLDIVFAREGQLAVVTDAEHG